MDIKDTKALERIGMTKNEISVYVALLELGTSTTGPVAHKSQIHTSRVYESLNKLIEKGLVSFVVKANRRYFSAADPNFLLDILDKQKDALSGVLPQLKLLQEQKKQAKAATIYEGYKGVKTVYNNILRTLSKSDEILVFGARGQDESFMANTFFKEYTQRRIKKGIKIKMIFNDDARETGRFYSSLKSTEVRYMPKNMRTPAAVDIWGDNVGILVLKPEPTVFLITSKEVAQSYREFFRLIWQMCKKQ